MLTLTGRLLAIATGEAGLPPETRDAYRTKFVAMGYSLPEITYHSESAPSTQVSTVGTEIRAIIESEIGRQLSCGDCIGYLRRLNEQETHDTADIVQHLYANFPWPAEWREQHKTPDARREAIAVIVNQAYSMQS